MSAMAPKSRRCCTGAVCKVARKQSTIVLDKAQCHETNKTNKMNATESDGKESEAIELQPQGGQVPIVYASIGRPSDSSDTLDKGESW